MFFDRIKQLCDQRGISPYKACTDIGLNRSAVAKWKNGGNPNGTTAAKLAEYFGVSVDYLLSDVCDDVVTSLANGITVFRSTSPEKIEALIGDLIPNSYRIAYRASGIAITVDNDASATDAEIDTIVNANRVDSVKTEKAPTETGERSVSDAELKFALWGNSEDMDDDDLADVRRYAAFVRERKKDRK